MQKEKERHSGGLSKVKKYTAFYVDIWYTGKTGKEERRRMQR